MLAPRSDISIEEAQRLIYLEAELLDEWRLDDWLKLYTDDMLYLVPSPGMPLRPASRRRSRRLAHRPCSPGATFSFEPVVSPPSTTKV